MGCGKSKNHVIIEPEAEASDSDTVAKKAKTKVAEKKKAEVTISIDLDGDGSADGNGVFVLQRKGGKAEKEGPFLPFVRFDVSAVPKQLFTADQIYISHVSVGRFLVADGTNINASAESAQESSLFVIERPDIDSGKPVTDGDWVTLRHFESGNFLTCLDDFNNLGLATRRDRGNGNEMQTFLFTKEMRPMIPSDGDIFFLQSWLSTFVEVDDGCADMALRAPRWHRGRAQRFSFRKKEVMEAKTTDLARLMQFQSIDLDGNSLATRAELGFLLKQAGLGESLDAVMTKVGEGGANKTAFKEWADSGAIAEEALQHIEVLGNVTQRFHDCLNDEGALIEILTTLPSQGVQAVCDAYFQLRGESLKDRIDAKTSEQTGYIFTKWWRQTMSQMLVSPVELWCQALQDAMEGWGTDENALTALVCTIPEELHSDIYQLYKTKTGQSLLQRIESETSSSYKKVLMAQANTLCNARCMALHSAISGLGTDEAQIIRIVTAADFGERRELVEAYERAYDRSLVEQIESEVSGDFKKILHAIFTAELAAFDLDSDCEALQKAMDAFGTDEVALIKLMCSKTRKQMEDIRARFHEKYGSRLEDRVEGETSGHFQAVLMGLIRDPIKQLATAVRDCIKGFGTCEIGLVTLLSHLAEYKRIALLIEYKRLFNRDLLKDIKNDTSSNFQQALLACVKLPPRVWAETLTTAMKGFGTNDGLLINFMCLAKDYMDEVRAEFKDTNKTELSKWIEGGCGNADYKKTLVQLALRNSEETIDMLPIYWAQRCRDALDDVNTLNDLVSSMPAIVKKRASVAYELVYAESIEKAIEAKCSEGKGFSVFSNWWKVCTLRLLDMPLQLRVTCLHEAMAGFGTDEYSLIACIMTIPENLHQDVQDLYKRTYEQKLVDRIESETSAAFKKVLTYATLSKVESRGTALHNAMTGIGTSGKQLVRIICCSTSKERELICRLYEAMYQRNLIAHIEAETSGHFKNAVIAILESNQASTSPDYEADVATLKEAMDGIGTDEDKIIRVVASKSDEEIETLCATYQTIIGEDLLARLNAETWDGGGLFGGNDFRDTMMLLLRPRSKRLAYATRYCIQGWGTDDTGLITCLVHLSEAERENLVHTYRSEFDCDLFDDIKSECSGPYEEALLACLRPPVETYCRALRSAIKGLGTSDNLLINMMCLCFDRMDEVRKTFPEVFEGQDLVSWIEGDCSGDYKDLLVRVAQRECLKFPGVELGVTSQAPPSGPEAIYRFNKTFNDLCRRKKAKPDEWLAIPEDAQQELGCAFLFWTAPGKSSCSPNMDIQALWEMTNAISSAENRFCPGNDGEDLRLTFREWDRDGTGEVAWNDFVHEMTVRVNDPNHYNAAPLKEEEPPMSVANTIPKRKSDRKPKAKSRKAKHG